MSLSERSSLELRHFTAIGLAALLPVVLLQPFQNAPFIDDWVYAWPVRHLLETGRLAVADYSTSPQLAHTLWGALFSLPFGFSFTALRFSTWLMWVLMLWGTYQLVRELGGTSRNALVAAGVVAVYPAGFILAFSFMTDIPFLAGMVWSCALFLRGLDRKRRPLIWLSVLAGCFATATRPTGISIFAAMIPVLLFHSDTWGRRAATLMAPLAGLTFAAVLLVFGRSQLLRSADMSGLENAPENRIAGLWDSVGMLWTTVPLTLVFLISAVGVALLPLAIVVMRSSMIRRAAPLFVAALSAWVGLGSLGIGQWVPLRACETWSMYELGMASCLTPGGSHASLPSAVEILVVLVGLGSGSLLISALTERSTRRDPLLLWLIGIQVGLSALLWLYHFDRYALPFALLIAALVMARPTDVRPSPALVIGTAYGALALVGLRDHLEFNRTVWDVVDRLRSRGVRVSEIDAGYVVNGWLQYTYPENAHRNEAGEISIPMVNSVDRLVYTVSQQERDGAVVLESVSYSGWLSRDGQIFVLEQRPGT